MWTELTEKLEGMDSIPHPPSGLKAAAVLVLLLPPTPSSPHQHSRLLLTLRSKQLRTHAGQLSFPGGKPELSDGSLIETALREAEEEVHLRRSSVRILGRLHHVETPTGFFIVPFVAQTDGSWEPKSHNEEVESILTPTLERLMDPSIYDVSQQQTPMGQTHAMHSYAICYPPLWGATARMTFDLLNRLHPGHTRRVDARSPAPATHN